MIAIRPDSDTEIPFDDLKEVGLAGLVEKQLARYLTTSYSTEGSSGLYERVMHEVERPLLRLVLRQVAGNRVKAAHLLGLNRATLLTKLRLHGLDTPRQSQRALRRKAIKDDAA